MIQFRVMKTNRETREIMSWFAENNIFFETWTCHPLQTRWYLEFESDLHKDHLTKFYEIRIWNPDHAALFRLTFSDVARHLQ